MATVEKNVLETLIVPDQKSQFPILAHGLLEALGGLGITRVGVAIAILNNEGEVLVEGHRGNHKVLPGTLCLPTETSKVSREGDIEDVARTMARGIAEELDYDPQPGDFTTRSAKPYTTTEWPVGNRGVEGAVLGINYAMLARESIADVLVGPKRNDEIGAAYFIPIENLLRSQVLRPGTEACITSLRDASLLDPGALAEVPVILPDIYDPNLLGPLE